MGETESYRTSGDIKMAKAVKGFSVDEPSTK